MRTAPLGPSVEPPIRPRNVVLGKGDACELRHWDLRWSSLWGHETLYWVGETHANCATGTFGGAPYGATKRCTGCDDYGDDDGDDDDDDDDDDHEDMRRAQARDGRRGRGSGRWSAALSILKRDPTPQDVWDKNVPG